MNIKVLEINKYGNDETLISFSSPYGTAHGFWMEQSPKINKSYNVEFDISQTLVWGKDIKKAGIDEYKIWHQNDIIYICAMFHSFEDNCCLTIRLGKTLILVETEGDPIINSQFLTISLRKMNIYPYTL